MNMQKLIIDGKTFLVSLNFMKLENKLIEVTCLSDSFRNYISSGIRYIEIDGKTSSDVRVKGRFQLLEHTDNTFIIKSINE